MTTSTRNLIIGLASIAMLVLGGWLWSREPGSDVGHAQERTDAAAIVPASASTVQAPSGPAATAVSAGSPMSGAPLPDRMQGRAQNFAPADSAQFTTPGQ